MILVTGGAGYIGSHACVELANRGYEIVVVDNLVNSHKNTIRNIQSITGVEIEFVECDVRSYSSMTSVFKKYDISAVYHFAGLRAVSESIASPLEYYDSNITGTLELLKVMSMFGCKNLIFSSSATVYGTPAKLPVAESAQLSSLNPYGHTKLTIERILGDLFHSDSSWNIAILRYFNPVGAHTSGLIGELSKGAPNNLFPLVSQTAIGERSHIEIFGDDYPTKDGTGVRDFIHVVDLAKGHLRAFSKFSPSGCFFAVNLGTGMGFSVLEVIKEFEMASGKKIPYVISARRAGDAASCYADVAYAEETIGWSAEKGLKEMCEDQWRWQLNISG